MWSKALPSGQLLTLDDSFRGVYLNDRSVLGDLVLWSDSVIGSYKRHVHVEIKRQNCYNGGPPAGETANITR
jgi:hypothetical protein